MLIEASSQEVISRSRNIRDALLVYLMIFSSGSVVFMSGGEKYLVLVFLLVLGAWLFFTDKRFSSGFALYLVVFTAFLFVIHLYTGGSLPIAVVVAMAMKLLLAYLILVIVGDNFIDSFIRVVVLLAAVSLFGYMTDMLQILDNVIHILPRVEDRNGYEGFLYIYRGMGSSIGRNASIFYEPGAYQIFLNIALFMLLFIRTPLSTQRKWIYASILLVALLTTLSTTGALIFGALFCLALIKSTVISGAGKTALIGVLIVVAAVFAEKFQYVIIEKINNYIATEEITDTKDQRKFGMMVDIEVFKRNIFGAGYMKYFREFQQIGLIRESVISANGISMTFAIYGFPFALFYFGSVFAFFNKYFSSILMKVVPFSILLMHLVSEGYYTFTPSFLALIAAVFAFSGKEEMPNRVIGNK